MTSKILTIMQNEDVRKAFGLRLKELRKQKGWTQKELANKIDIRFSQLNKYECGMHIPPIEKLIQLGNSFRVTLDYLIMGNYLLTKKEQHPLCDDTNWKEEFQLD